MMDDQQLREHLARSADLQLRLTILRAENEEHLAAAAAFEQRLSAEEKHLPKKGRTRHCKKES